MRTADAVRYNGTNGLFMVAAELSVSTASLESRYVNTHQCQGNTQGTYAQRICTNNYLDITQEEVEITIAYHYLLRSITTTEYEVLMQEHFPRSSSPAHIWDSNYPKTAIVHKS